MLFALLMMAIPFAQAAKIDDAAALAEMKTGKGVFLVDIGDAKKLAFYLDVIRGTHAGMVKQGVEPDFILVYIGPSVKYLTSQPNEDDYFDNNVSYDKIAENVAELGKLGVRQEICAVATRVFGVKNETVLPALTLVGDGFISLIGWQAQGYHLVPVF